MSDPFSLVNGILGTYVSLCEIFKQIQTIRRFRENAEVQVDILELQALRVVAWGESHKLRDTRTTARHTVNQKADEQLSKILAQFESAKSVLDKYGVQYEGSVVAPAGFSQPDFNDDPPEIGFQAVSKLFLKKSLKPVRRLQWGVIGREELRERCDIIVGYIDALNDVWPPPSDTVIPHDHSLVATRLQALLEDVLQFQKPQDLARLEYWLGIDLPRFNPLQDLETIMKRLAPDTCEWIEKDSRYTRWKSFNLPQPSPTLLWLSGPPGYGKSFMCTSLICSLQKQGENIAFFFSTKHAQTSGSIDHILRFWMMQMAEKDVELRKIMLKYCSSDNAPARATEHHVWVLFKQVLQLQKCWVFVIDGVDEYFRNQISEDNPVEENKLFLLKMIEICQDFASNCRVLVVSRPFNAFKSAFQHANELHSLSVSRILIAKEEVTQDIRSISRGFVRSHLRKFSIAEQDELVDLIAKSSCGSFLWLDFVMKRLKPSARKGLLLKLIQDVPVDLTERYNRELAVLRNKDPGQTLSIFSWIMLAKRPISVWELCQILAVEGETSELTINPFSFPEPLDDEWVDDHILAFCGDMILPIARDDEWLGLTILSPSHPSVSDYILPMLHSTESNCWRQQLFENIPTEISVQLRMAMTCLAFLSNQDINLELDIERPAVDAPLLKDYALKFWHLHLKEAPDRRLFPLSQLLDFFRVDNVQFIEWAIFFEANNMETSSTPADIGTPLYYAVLLDLETLATELSQTKAIYLNTIGGRYGTALMVALMLQKPLKFEMLLRAKADPNISTDFGNVYLKALELEADQYLDLLIEYGVDVKACDANRANALHVIAGISTKLRPESIARFDSLLAELDINAEDNSGRTPMALALGNGHMKLLRYLTPEGTSPSIAHINRLDARRGIQKLVDKKRIDVFEYMWNKWPGFEIPQLLIGCMFGKLELVQKALEWIGKDDIAKVSFEGPLAQSLIGSIALKHVDIVRLLLSKGSGRVDYPLQPIHLACIAGVDMVRAVLDHDPTTINATSVVLSETDARPSFYVKDFDGMTCIMFAAACEREDIIQVLLEVSGIDLSIRSTSGLTILHYAAGAGLERIVAKLIDRMPPNSLDKNIDNNALYEAIHNGHTSLTKTLLDKGFKILSRTVQIELLHETVEEGQHDMVELLVELWRTIVDGEIDESDLLEKAMNSGNNKVVSLLCKSLNQRSAANQIGQQGWTPLQKVILCGAEDDAMELLSRIEPQHVSATIDHGNEQHIPALHVAAFRGFSQLVLALLARNASAVKLDDSGKTPLFHAITGGHLGIVRILIDHLRHSGNIASVTVADTSGDTSLHLAARGGQTEIVRLLVQNGATVAVKAKNGRTPIVDAARFGSGQILAILIESLADEEKVACLDAIPENGANAVYEAAERGHIQALRVLINNGASVSKSRFKGWSPLNAAADSGFTEVCRLLLACPDVSTSDLNDDGRAAIHTAARHDFWRIIELFLDKDAACANLKTSDGSTALLLAAASGHYRTVHVLLGRSEGSFVNVSGWFRRTPLLAAAASGDLRTVQLLLECHDLDVDGSDDTNRTALYNAVYGGHSRIVKLLLECPRISTRRTDIQGRTALHVACWTGWTGIVQQLLAHDIESLNAQDCYGATPLSLATRNKRGNVVCLLMKTKGLKYGVKDHHGFDEVDWMRSVGLLDNLPVKETNDTMLNTVFKEFSIPGTLAGTLCDVCTLLFEQGADAWHCGICFDGDFDICQACVNRGDGCLDKSHQLELMPGIEDSENHVDVSV